MKAIINKKTCLMFLIILLLANKVLRAETDQLRPEPEYCKLTFFTGTFVKASGDLSISPFIKLSSALDKLQEKLDEQEEICKMAGGTFSYCNPNTRSNGGRNRKITASTQYKCDLPTIN